jgi:ATP-dependent Clp protease adapter protein ClpS
MKFRKSTRVPTQAELLASAQRVRALLDQSPTVEELATPDLRRALERARRDAHEGGDETATVEHLLRSIVEEPTGADVLSKCGADMEALDRELDHLLALSSAARPPAEILSLAHDRVLLFAKAHTLSAGLTQMSIGDVLAALLIARSEESSKLLAKQGVSRLDVLNYICHGIEKDSIQNRKSPARLPRAHVANEVEGLRGSPGRYLVIVHNDTYTTQEFVSEMLSSVFGKSDDEARVLMTAVHERGSGVVAEYDLRLAVKKVAKANRRAQKAGFPLRMTIQPAP